MFWPGMMEISRVALSLATRVLPKTAANGRAIATGPLRSAYAGIGAGEAEYDRLLARLMTLAGGTPRTGP